MKSKWKTHKLYQFRFQVQWQWTKNCFVWGDFKQSSTKWIFMESLGSEKHAVWCWNLQKNMHYWVFCNQLMILIKTLTATAGNERVFVHIFQTITPLIVSAADFNCKTGASCYKFIHSVDSAASKFCTFICLPIKTQKHIFWFL